MLCVAACPSAVSVEVSRDGLSAVPLCAPQPTSGLPHIKLQLLKPEVVTAVTLRLHKPRCLATIGLSQIMLLGNAAFRETNVSASSMFQPTEDYVSRTRWVVQLVLVSVDPGKCWLFCVMFWLI